MTYADQTNLEEFLGIEGRKSTFIERAEYYARAITREKSQCGSDLPRGLGANGIEGSSGTTVDISTKQAIRNCSANTGRSERDLYRDLRLSRAFNTLPDWFQRRVRSGQIKGTKASVLALASCSKGTKDAIIRDAEARGSLSQAVKRHEAQISKDDRSTPKNVPTFTELPHPRAIPRLKIDILQTIGELRNDIKILSEEITPEKAEAAKGILEGILIQLEARIRDL